MARAYSMDLRSRVIEAALSDGSIRQAARRFGARRYTQLQSPQVYTQKGFVENDDELGRGRNADRRPGR